MLTKIIITDNKDMIELLDYRKDKIRLRTPGRKIDLSETQTEEFQNNIQKMKEILALDGVGLAATQVGWPVQLFMLCIDENDQKIEPEIFLNAEITAYSKAQIKMEEGCLSFKGLFLPIKRPAEVSWRYITLDGKITEKNSQGFYARAVQHEVDHCLGRVFIDRASTVMKMRVKKWLKSE